MIWLSNLIKLYQTNTKATINLSVSVGDFSSRQSGLNGSITSQHSNIVLDETTGKLSLQARYGSLNLKYGKNQMNLMATCYATDVLVSNKTCQTLNIELKGVACPLTMTQECFIADKKLLKSNYHPDNGHAAWTLLYTPTSVAPSLKITAHYGTMTLL